MFFPTVIVFEKCQCLHLKDGSFYFNTADFSATVEISRISSLVDPGRSSLYVISP